LKVKCKNQNFKIFKEKFKLSFNFRNLIIKLSLYIDGKKKKSIKATKIESNKKTK